MTERDLHKRDIPNGTNFLENRERPLFGKVALITGSSRDIGAGIAIALAKEGVQIIGNYLNKPKKAEQVIKEIERIDGRIDFVQADITVSEDRQGLMRTLTESFGGQLDYLVLNTSGNQETARAVCVEANNALVDMFLPKMSEGGTIILMQSVPGHYVPQLRGLDRMPEFYDPISEAKYEGEQLLRMRIPEFQKKGASLIVVCPPIVSETSNVKMFDRESERKYGVTATDKHAEISDMLGISKAVTKEDVGKKVAELLKRRDIPMGYIELFGNVLDARAILFEWYGDNAIFVDTVEIQDQNKGIGRMIVARDYAKGHFNERVGFSVLPGHIMIEAAAQTLGLVALNGHVGENSMPMFQGMEGVRFFKVAKPGEGLRINGEITEIKKRGFMGNVSIKNTKDEEVAEFRGIKAAIVSKNLAERLFRN